MATNKGRTRSALGNNPLSQGIFNKTELSSMQDQGLLNNQDSIINNIENKFSNQESIILNQDKLPLSQVPIENMDSVINNQESIKNNQESSFLAEQVTERVNLRLSMEINDWLDGLLKQGKRKYGRKIPKETWIQAALELFRALPVDWHEIDSEATLRKTLEELESRINNQ